MLSWTELCEVVLEVETQLNRRPLSYVEDDIQFPLLTPASFLFQRTNRLPEQEPWREETVDLRKRAKYLRSCKDALWKPAGPVSIWPHLENGITATEKPNQIL